MMKRLSFELTVLIALERNAFKAMVIGRNIFVCFFKINFLIQFQNDTHNIFFYICLEKLCALCSISDHKKMNNMCHQRENCVNLSFPVHFRKLYWNKS